METMAHQIRLVPNRSQEVYFRKACGVARFVWNWALAEWKRRYEAGQKVDGLKLKKDFNALKPLDYPWTYEVTKYASQQPFLQLQGAFRRFFDRKARYPRFKRKGVNDSFYIGGDHIQLSGQRIRIPRLGWVRSAFARSASAGPARSLGGGGMREALRFKGRVPSATVRCIADRWFVSIQVEVEEAPTKPCEGQAGIGVDLGVNRLATLSNGEEFEGPKPLRQNLRKLRRLSRRLSRKQKGSKNREKARIRLARLHYRIQCIRQDALHKLTSYLTENFSHIAIEDLNVRSMLRNRRLARAILDMGFYKFRRQLEYKTRMHGNHLNIVDRWFASSKSCSRCGLVKKSFGLGERVFVCASCGFKSDRDLNAAMNLLRTVSSTGRQACGERGSGSSGRWSETILCEAGTWN